MTRRYDDGGGEGAITPGGGWPGLLGKVLERSGPVALIALVLCGFLMAAVWRRLVSIEDKIDGARVQMNAFANGHEKQQIMTNQQIAAEIAILRQLCINSARNEQQQAACLVEPAAAR